MHPHQESGECACERCGRTFKELSSLLRHQSRCDPAWRCGWCGRRQSETASRSTGPDGPSTLCQSCGYQHRKSAAPRAPAQDRLICRQCGKVCKGMRGLAKHLSSCDVSWRCDWCSCTLMQTSCKRAGPGGAATLCASCAQRYRAGRVGPVVGGSASGRAGPWACALCSRLFASAQVLAEHAARCGQNLVCDRCGLKCKDHAQLAHHRHTCCEPTAAAAAWACAWCGCGAANTSAALPGPDGPGTLCTSCGHKYRGGDMQQPRYDPRHVHYSAAACVACGAHNATVPGPTPDTALCTTCAYHAFASYAAPYPFAFPPPPHFYTSPPPARVPEPPRGPPMPRAAPMPMCPPVRADHHVVAPTDHRLQPVPAQAAPTAVAAAAKKQAQRRDPTDPPGSPATKKQRTFSGDIVVVI